MKISEEKIIKLKLISSLVAIFLVINVLSFRSILTSAATTTNVALGFTPTYSCSVTNPLLPTDGSIGSVGYFYFVDLNKPGLQWIQLDLGQIHSIEGLNVWRYRDDGRKYHDVIYQISNDPNFKTNVTTVYNNDTDNSAGLGKGSNTEFVETASGHKITFSSVNARYIRLWSNGNSVNNYNHYAEVEVISSGIKTLYNVAQWLIPSYSCDVINPLNATDGNTTASGYYFTNLNVAGLQWIQLDLGQIHTVEGLNVWRYRDDGRKYRDVIYQLSNDPNFKTNVTTVYNNDTDNSAGLGKGSNTEFMETASGHKISIPSIKARYIRLWSNGNSVNSYNHYAQVEVLPLTKLPINKEGWYISLADVPNTYFSTLSQKEVSSFIHKLDNMCTVFADIVGKYPNGKIVFEAYSGGGAAAWWIPKLYYPDYMIVNDIKKYGASENNAVPSFIMHELGHIFDFGRNWTGDTPMFIEHFANIKYYIVSDITGIPIDLNSNYPAQDKSGIERWFKVLAGGSFENTWLKNTSHNEGLTYIYIQLYKLCGVNAFKNTFRYFNKLGTTGYPSLPQTNIGKFNLFMTKLKEYSGKDVSYSNASYPNPLAFLDTNGKYYIQNLIRQDLITDTPTSNEQIGYLTGYSG